MNQDVLNVAYHCTDNYIRITGTSIVSVFENNKDFKEINVYIIDHGFTDETKKKCMEMADRYGRHIYFIPLPDLNKEYDLGLVSIKKKWMFDSYSRLFLDKLLPESVERVVYLDGDILVLKSLKKLWNLDLKGKCCAAALDCVGKPYYDLFGMSEKSRYCNSGVMLIDLDQWRKQYIDARVKQYVRSHNGYVFFMEQTVFNAVLQDEIVYLPAKYNVSSLMQTLSYEDLVRMRKPKSFYSEKEIRMALDAPVIVHMTGFFYVINRAWNKVTNHPEQQRFLEYSKKLEWPGEILQDDKRDGKTKLQDYVIHHMPKKVLIPLVSYLYNNWRIRKIFREAKKVNRL